MADRKKEDSPEFQYPKAFLLRRDASRVNVNRISRSDIVNFACIDSTTKSVNGYDSSHEQSDREGKIPKSNLYPSLNGFGTPGHSASESEQEPKSDFESSKKQTEVETRRRKSKTSKSKSKSPPVGVFDPTKDFHPESARQQCKGTPDNNLAVQIIIIAIIAAVVVVFGYKFVFLGGATSKARANLVPVFDNKIQDLRTYFVNQPAHNWAIVRSSFAEVLNSSAYEYGPAVLAIMAHKRDRHLSECFAEKLASSLSRTFNPNEKPISMNGLTLAQNQEPVAAKHTIDNAVKGKDNFVMVFTDLEAIDSYTASIFHSLCDYFYSPFKERAVFIFTVHTDEEVEGKKRKHYDKMADRVLNDAWESLDLNKRSALIARLTGSTILLKKESKRVC